MNYIKVIYWFYFGIILLLAASVLAKEVKPKVPKRFRCTFEVNDCGIQNQYAISSNPSAAFFNWSLTPEPGMYLISKGKIGNGARLITPFFHHNLNGPNCLLIKYHLDGPGARELKITMQDRNDLELKSVTDKESYTQTMKIPVKPRSSPRFFITALFDANQHVDIAIKDVYFVHLSCGQVNY